MRLRAGLQAKFLSIMAVAFLAVATLIVLLLHRQERIQAEVVGVSRDAMRDSLAEGLRRHGEGEVTQLAGSLTNPLYYFDLDAIGELSRAALANPGVRYVVVYDDEGNIVHDGSEEIPSYGKRMDDAMAGQIVAARTMHTQWGENTFDVSAPINIGQQRLAWGVRGGHAVGAERGRDHHVDSAEMLARRQQQGALAQAGGGQLAVQARDGAIGGKTGDRQGDRPPAHGAHRAERGVVDLQIGGHIGVEQHRAPHDPLTVCECARRGIRHAGLPPVRRSYVLRRERLGT